MTVRFADILELTELRQLANKKSKLRAAAQRALTKAEELRRKGMLGLITVDRKERSIQVHENAPIS